MIKTKHKLALARETIATLQTSELDHVAGGNATAATATISAATQVISQQVACPPASHACPGHEPVCPHTRMCR